MGELNKSIKLETGRLGRIANEQRFLSAFETKVLAARVC